MTLDADAAQGIEPRSLHAKLVARMRALITAGEVNHSAERWAQAATHEATRIARRRRDGRAGAGILERHPANKLKVKGPRFSEKSRRLDSTITSLMWRALNAPRSEFSPAVQAQSGQHLAGIRKGEITLLAGSLGVQPVNKRRRPEKS